MDGPEDFPFPGVVGLDHTADLGILVGAPDLPTLFERAARGSLWLALERHPKRESASLDPVVDGDDERGSGRSARPRKVELVEEDLALLLRSWLRTLLLWAETEGFVATEYRLALVPAPLCGPSDGQAFGLRASVTGVADTGPRAREIKGVTFHGLEVGRADQGWQAQVIFDV